MIEIESAAGQYDRGEEESWVEEEERQSQERHSSFRQGASRACIIDCPGLVLPSLVSSRAEMVCCRPACATSPQSYRVCVGVCERE